MVEGKEWILIFMVLALTIVAQAQTSDAPSDYVYQVNGEKVEPSEGNLFLPKYKGYKEVRRSRVGYIPETAISEKKGEVSITSLFEDREDVSYYQTNGDRELNFRLSDLEWNEDWDFTSYQKTPAAFRKDGPYLGWYERRDNYFPNVNSYLGAANILRISKDIWEEQFTAAIETCNLKRDSTRSELDVRYETDFRLAPEILSYKKYKVGSDIYYEDDRRWSDGLELEMRWVVLDVYGDQLMELVTKSPRIFYRRGVPYESGIPPQVRDAVLHCLSEFLKSVEFTDLLKGIKEESEKIQAESLQVNSGTKIATSLDEALQACVTVIYKSEKYGSGCIISDEGHVITSYVPEVKNEHLQIILSNGSRYDAKVLRISKKEELVVLQFEGGEFYTLSDGDFDLDESIGMEIYAIGTPSFSDLGQSVSKGIVSGLRKVGNGTKLMQTDAKISPGFGGGAIVTENGQLVGLVKGKLTGFGIEGLAFGMPITYVIGGLNIDFR